MTVRELLNYIKDYQVEDYVEIKVTRRDHQGTEEDNVTNINKLDIGWQIILQLIVDNT